MANASGPANSGFIPADFVHAASGIHYKVTEKDGQVWLSYKRVPASSNRELSGREELRYFIGSGKRGRTYLFEREGYWFEAPINWYGKRGMWDMAPHFLDAKEMPLTLPVDPGCLHCHASGVSRSLPDARNHFAGEPFASGGITCVSCHGDASAHLASGGKVRMLEIDELEPIKRDSICLNCHLEGQAAVVREGKRLEDFKPGDSLFNYALFFVYRSGEGSEGRAVSQWEALLKSECMKKSGGRMTCTTCHDPHGSPPAEERVAFYRKRCLACHDQPGFAKDHHPENLDCTECHMARLPSNDIAHEQVTDHWIRKRVTQARLPLATTGELVTVGGFVPDERDLGLAYAQMATRGDQDSAIRAINLLRKAEKQANGAPSDYELHTQLGFLDQLSGEMADSAAEYRQALASNGFDSVAAGNLAVIEARKHHYTAAISLWRSVFEHDPAQIEAGMNLAIVECASGRRDLAESTLRRVLVYSPDNAQGRELETGIHSGEQACTAK
ncbi:MAG TPA: cytochrome c3 family protein [Terracidiphilus sp.]|nr:cytochrome c3 family protein [Terracidiphilus sp.]